MAVGHSAQQWTAFPRILQGWHIKVVDQHNVWVLPHTHAHARTDFCLLPLTSKRVCVCVCAWYLQQPVASSVECRHNGGMDVAAIQALRAEGQSQLISDQ